METTKSLSLGTKSKNSLEIQQAIIDTIPIMIGVIPFGITCGIMGITAGLQSWEVIFMSLLVFAGASQFVAIGMLGAGISSWGLIVFTTLLINLRHLLMGASLYTYLNKLPIHLQGLISFTMVDESYALTSSRLEKVGYSHYYQLGSSVALYLVWSISTFVGVYFANYIPNPLEWGLDFAIPATFLVLLLPRLNNYIAILVFLTAAIVSVVGILYVPGNWYIIISCLAASMIGVIVEGREPNEK